MRRLRGAEELAFLTLCRQPPHLGIVSDAQPFEDKGGGCQIVERAELVLQCL